MLFKSKIKLLARGLLVFLWAEKQCYESWWVLTSFLKFLLKMLKSVHGCTLKMCHWTIGPFSWLCYYYIPWGALSWHLLLGGCDCQFFFFFFSKLCFSNCTFLTAFLTVAFIIEPVMYFLCGWDLEKDLPNIVIL